MLTADTKLDIRLVLMPFSAAILFEPAGHAVLIQSCEGIGFIEILLLVVLVKELTCIVFWRIKGHLRQSLVPNEKNSAFCAISSARSAALGISIMVPTWYLISEFFSFSPAPQSQPQRP